MNDDALVLHLVSLLLPNLLVKAILLQDELRLCSVINNSASIFDDDFLHVVDVDLGVRVALVANGEQLTLEDVLSHDYFVSLAL